MAFDEGLAERIRTLLEDRDDLAERRMFGGLCFLQAGNMCFGVMGNDLMVRVGRDAHDDALAQEHARKMDFTGRPMRGMVIVADEGVSEDDALAAWLDRGLRFSESLPPK